MPPESKPSKPYRTYRGGRAGGSDDADAARFDFTGRSAGAAAPARAPTPEGLPAPDMRPPPESAPRAEGRDAAPPPGGPGTGPGFFRRRWRRILAIAIPVVLLLFAFWLYLGYRAFSDEVAKANKRIDKRTKAALAPAGNILRDPQISLVMGSDSRGKSATLGARADSILLVRTDPGKSPHLDALDPARPVRPDPRPRREQDQRRVRVRRAAASHPHGQPAHQPQGEPRRPRRLLRLQGPDRRPRAGSPS